jgi:hypothetical protein
LPILGQFCHGPDASVHPNPSYLQLLIFFIANNMMLALLVLIVSSGGFMESVEWSEILKWVPSRAQASRDPDVQQPDHGGSAPQAEDGSHPEAIDAAS